MGMYWYTKNLSKKLVLFAGLALGLHACSSPEVEKKSEQKAQAYFDIPSFIQQEIDSLKQANPTVNKTVTKDKEEETKDLKIKDWDNEFSSFKAIDLNKPAYAGFIELDTVDSVIEYNFTNPDLDLACVRIAFNEEGKVKMLSVDKHVKNTLYQTSEFLVYEKGNFYIVEKNQKVRVMGENYYKVQGNLKADKAL